MENIIKDIKKINKSITKLDKERVSLLETLKIKHQELFFNFLIDLLKFSTEEKINNIAFRISNDKNFILKFTSDDPAHAFYVNHWLNTDKAKLFYEKYPEKMEDYKKTLNLLEMLASFKQSFLIAEKFEIVESKIKINTKDNYTKEYQENYEMFKKFRTNSLLKEKLPSSKKTKTIQI